MPELSWYRSLYWRIAVGFVALLATLLVLQGLVFLWMTGRMTDLFPSRSPAQFAANLANDLGTIAAEQPDLDLRAYVARQYGNSFRGFVVVMKDGTSITGGRVSPPPTLVRSARFRLFGDRFGGPGPALPPDLFPRDDRFGDGSRGRGDGPGDGRGRRGFRGAGDRGGPGGGIEYAPIVAEGTVVGMVAVLREGPPMSVALRDLGPTLATVALVLLAAGTAVAALVIVGPTRKRLRVLQNAAREIGTGAVGVRAPETGGDEVTALSLAFNEMAGQLEQRTLALETADRTRRQLLADVSHELMTPLSSIRGYVETLRMPDLEISDEARGRYLRIVNEESDRLEQIIGDLLELARLEGGGGSLKHEPVSISGLMERVRHRHEPTAIEKDIILATSEAPGLGRVLGDQHRLEQALQNLVANAIRHTPAGGKVSVHAEDDAGYVRILVQDTGAGIAPDHLERVFDRFHKVDESRTETDMPSGSGLGLSIVQAIVVRHGGTVTASNAEDGGAKFEIRLPVAEGTGAGT